MTESVDLLNAGEVVLINGQAWTLSHLGPAIRAAFSAWIKARARQGLQEERRDGILSAEEYRVEADALKRQFDAGSYNWGSPFYPDSMGEAVLVALNGMDGKLKLMQLLLEKSHGSVPVEQLIELMGSDSQALAEAMGRCMDPNRQVPAEKPGSTTKTTKTMSTPAKDSPTLTASPYSPAAV